MATLHLSTLLFTFYLVTGGKNKCNGWDTEFRCTKITPESGTTYYDWMCCAQGDEHCGYFQSASGEFKTETLAETDLHSVTVHKGTHWGTAWDGCTSRRLCHFQYFDDENQDFYEKRAPCDAKEGHGQQRKAFGDFVRDPSGILHIHPGDVEKAAFGVLKKAPAKGKTVRKGRTAESIARREERIGAKSCRPTPMIVENGRDKEGEVRGDIIIKPSSETMILKSAGDKPYDIWIFAQHTEKSHEYNPETKTVETEEIIPGVEEHEHEKYKIVEGALWKQYLGDALKVIDHRTRKGKTIKTVGVQLSISGKREELPLSYICYDGTAGQIKVKRYDEKAKTYYEEYIGHELTYSDGMITYKEVDETPMASAAGGDVRPLSAVGASAVRRSSSSSSSSSSTVHAKVEYHDIDRRDYQNADSYAIPGIYSPYDHYRGYNNRNVIQFVLMVFAVVVFCAACCCSNLGTAISCFLLGKRQMIRESNKNEIEEDVLSP